MCESSSNVKILAKCVEKFYGEIRSNPTARNLSWDHCYLHFQNNKNKNEDASIDLMALHLGFYLASWGMMRGSSFLLKNDYKVHKPVIKLLIDSEYKSLSDTDMINIDEHVLKIIELKKNIIEAYKVPYENVNNGTKPKNVDYASDVLVTKILLGTHCCTPAYDQYFMAGIQKHGVIHQFGVKSLKGIVKFYNDNSAIFNNEKIVFQGTNKPYPAMKIIDMAFWQRGCELDL